MGSAPSLEALARELEALVESAASESAISLEAPTLRTIAEEMDPAVEPRVLLLRGIGHLSQRPGLSTDGKKFEYHFHQIARALEALFGEGEETKLTDRREAAAKALGSYSYKTGERNTPRLCRHLANAILDVAGVQPVEGFTTSAPANESVVAYQVARGSGLGAARRWAEDDDQSLTIARTAVGALQTLCVPDLTLASTEPSSRDDRVIQSASHMALGAIDIEIVAEGLGASAFEGGSRLRELLEIAEIPGTPLVLRLLPSPVCPTPRGRPPFLEFVRRWGLLIAPLEVDALVAGDISLPDLIALKLYRGIAEGRPVEDVEIELTRLREYSKQPRHHQLRPADQVLSALPVDPSVPHPKLPRLVDRIRGGVDVLVVGQSSSGKSTLIVQIAEALAEEMPVLYLNFGETPVVSPHTVHELLFGIEDRTVLLVDDLQSFPSGAEIILGSVALRKEIRPHDERTLTIGASTWREYSQRANEALPGVQAITVSPRDLGTQLTQRFGGSLSAEQRRFLADKFGEDLHLLRLALQLHSGAAAQDAADSMATASEIAVAFLQRVRSNVSLPDDVLERALLVLSALGRYDIAASRQFIARAAQIDQSHLDSLLAANVGRLQDSFMRLGHRSLCTILADELEQMGAWGRLADAGGVRTSDEVVTSYLESLPAGPAIASLRAICARARFDETQALDRRAQQIVQIWSAFDALVERVTAQQLADPTWGSTPSSCMYACEAFAAVGDPGRALDSLGFLREVCTVTNTGVTIDLARLSTSDDFQLIREKIETVETVREVPLTPHGDVVPDIDRFHSTWVAGLWLTAEAAIGDSQRTRELVSAFERMRLPSGAFYPESVPWVTARALMALGAAGRTIDTSDAVRSATAWLLTSAEAGGPCRGGVWYPGTGGWNSIVESTAMVLAALGAVGFDDSDRRLRPGMRLIEEKRDSWMEPTNDLDGALAIRSLLETGTPWEVVADDAVELSTRSLDDALWMQVGASAKESHAQSCNTAQISTDLLKIAWAAVRSNIPALLRAIEFEVAA